MTCPACQAELRGRTKAGVEIDECAGCGGFWFDGDELARYRTRLGRPPAADVYAFEAARDSKATACPRCRVLTLRSGNSGSLRMLACRNCRGVFLARSVFASLGKVKTSTVEMGHTDLFDLVDGEDLIDVVIEIASAIW